MATEKPVHGDKFLRVVQAFKGMRPSKGRDVTTEKTNMVPEKPIHSDKFLHISRSFKNMDPLKRAVYDIIRTARRDKGVSVSNIQESGDIDILSFFVPSMEQDIHIRRHIQRYRTAAYGDGWDMVAGHYSVIINDAEITAVNGSVLEMQIDKFLQTFDKQIMEYEKTRYNDAVQSLNQLVQRMRQSRIH